MDYAAHHERFDAFNFNRYQSSIQTEISSGLSKILTFLSGYISYNDAKKDMPRGTVTYLSAQNIADGTGLCVSTVRSHLAAGKKGNHIASETLRDARSGRTLGVRYYFTGFVRWLLEGGYKASGRKQIAQKPAKEGVQEAGVLGSENSDPNNITDSSNKIILDDDILNLKYEGSVKYTEIEEKIREAGPKVNGKAADPNVVWQSFRAFNLKKGYKSRPLSWLLGWCRVFGRKWMEPKKIEPSDDDKTSQTPVIAPSFDSNDSFDQVAKIVFDQSPCSWSNWFAPLKTRKSDTGWIIECPTGFHARYLEQNFGDLLKAKLGGYTIH